MEIFLDDISYVPERDVLVGRAGVESGSDEAGEFIDLMELVASRMRPKAYVMSAVVELCEEPRLRLNGEEFCGTILYDNLKELGEVWPYVATCGGEAYDFVMGMVDPFERFWGEMVLQDGLRVAEARLYGVIESEVYGGKAASIAPGSLEEWPIEQQGPLFRVLGEGGGRAGVRLTETFLMLPNKSISGIRFPNEHGYVSCRFCPREGCEGRRVAYEAEASMTGM